MTWFKKVHARCDDEVASLQDHAQSERSSLSEAGDALTQALSRERSLAADLAKIDALMKQEQSALEAVKSVRVASRCSSCCCSPSASR